MTKDKKMTIDDLINWQGPGGTKAKVRLASGVDPGAVDLLAPTLTAVRAVAPEVDHYDDQGGLRISFSGNDTDGTPIFDIGRPPAGASRLPAYQKVDEAMTNMVGGKDSCKKHTLCLTSPTHGISSCLCAE